MGIQSRPTIIHYIVTFLPFLPCDVLRSMIAENMSGDILGVTLTLIAGNPTVKQT